MLHHFLACRLSVMRCGSKVGYLGHVLSVPVLCLIAPKTTEFIKTQPGDVTSAGTCTLTLFPPISSELSLSLFNRCQTTFPPSHVILHFLSVVPFLSVSSTFCPSRASSPLCSVDHLFPYFTLRILKLNFKLNF